MGRQGGFLLDTKAKASEMTQKGKAFAESLSSLPGSHIEMEGEK